MSTSTPRNSWGHVSHHLNPSYVVEEGEGGNTSGLEALVAGDKAATKEFKKMYSIYDHDASPYTLGMRNGRRVYAATKRGRGGGFRPLFIGDGKTFTSGVSKEFKYVIGPTAVEFLKENEAVIAREREQIANLREMEGEANAEGNEEGNEGGNVINEFVEQIIERENNIQERVQENEAILERMSLKDRVKADFKKYGLTVVGVATAVGVIIGVIVSSLQSGLTSVAKGVGNGLKELGKKLGQILPGMVGATASFVFRTAGEVVGFLAKNAWLLIVAVVVYFVERVKKGGK